MPNPAHVSKLNQGVGSWNEWRQLHPEIYPDLSFSTFSDVDLHDADLTNVDLSGCDLKDARGLIDRNLAGANLARAVLPGYLKIQDSTQNLQEVSKNSRPMLLTIVLACFYCWLTIGTCDDLSLVANTSSSPLPIIDASIPMVGFFFVAPILLLSVYIYFHVYLQKLWHGLGQLPAVFPDGHRLDEAIYPWLLNAFVGSNLHFLSKRKQALHGLQFLLGCFLSWWIIPCTIIIFWLRFLTRQDWLGTGFHIALISFSIGAALFFYRSSIRVLNRQKAPTNSIRIAKATLAMVVTVICYTAISFSVFNGKPKHGIHKIAEKFGYSFFADFEAKALLPARLPEGFESHRPENPDEVLDASPATKPAVLDRIRGVEMRDRSLRHARASRPFFVNADLHGADMESSEFKYAIFAGANLGQATLTNADLSGADLRWADLRGASLAGTNLMDANLHHAVFNDLVVTGSRTSFARQLKGSRNWILAHFDETLKNSLLGYSGNTRDRTDFSGLDLSRYDLRTAKLQSHNLQRSNLDFAKLQGALLSRSDLSGASFHGALLNGADLKNAKLTGTEFNDADLSGVNLQAAILWGTDFSNAIVTSSQIRQTKGWVFAKFDPHIGSELKLKNDYADRIKRVLAGESLSGIDLSSMDLRTADFSSTYLNGTNFSGSNLTDSVFIGADLRDANFDYAKLDRSNLYNAKLNGANISGESLKKSANWIFSEFGKNLWLRLFPNREFAEKWNLSAEEKDLSGYDFGTIRFKGVTFENFDFSNSILNNVIFEDCIVYNSNFFNSKLRQASFVNTSIYNSNFTQSDLVSARFEAEGKEVKIVKSTFKGAELNNSLFSRLKIEQTDFSSADLAFSQFRGCSIIDPILRETSLVNAQITKTDLSEEDLREAAGVNWIWWSAGADKAVEWNSIIPLIDEVRKTWELDPDVALSPETELEFLDSDLMQPRSSDLLEALSVKFDAHKPEQDDSLNILGDVVDWLASSTNLDSATNPDSGFVAFLSPDSEKPNLRLMLMGHENHGMSVLREGIRNYAMHTEGFSDQTLKIVSGNYELNFESSNRVYTITDPASYREGIIDLIGRDSDLDGAILVVSTADGIMAETRDYIYYARKMGVPKFVVYLSKLEFVEDNELVELVEMEVRELLDRYDYPGDDVSIIRGSALQASNNENNQHDSIKELLGAIDMDIPPSIPTVDRNFLMSIEDVFSLTGRKHIVATGRIVRGRVEKDETVEVVGLDDTQSAVVEGIEMFRKELEEARAGDNVGIMLSGVSKGDLNRGRVLAKPQTIESHTNCRAEVYVLSQGEGGRHTPFFDGYQPQFYFRTTSVSGVCNLLYGNEMVMPGDVVSIEISLSESIAMEKWQRFAIREGGRTIGIGRVTEVIE